MTSESMTSAVICDRDVKCGRLTPLRTQSKMAVPAGNGTGTGVGVPIEIETDRLRLPGGHKLAFVIFVVMVEPQWVSLQAGRIILTLSPNLR
jgi:hypothetical protein